MDKKIESYLFNDKIRIYYRCWIPKQFDKIIIGVHGILEHGGRYNNLAEFLVNHDYAFCIQDLRGHGKSASEHDRGFINKFEDFLDDLSFFINYISRNYNGKKIYLFGHSMGGLITVYYSGRIGKNIDGIITSGAAVYIDPPPIIKKILLLLTYKISPRKRIRLPISANELTNDLHTNKEYLEDPLVIKDPTTKLIVELYNASINVWRYVANIRIPALIMHGKKDKIVPPKASIMLYEKITSSDKKLLLFDNSKHELINDIEKEKVFEEVLKWLSTH